MMVRHEKPKVKEELKHGLKYVLVPIWTKLSEGMECYSARVRRKVASRLDDRTAAMRLYIFARFMI